MRALIDEVYALMTAGAAAWPAARPTSRCACTWRDRLPEADVARMEGLLELLVGDPFGGRADLPKLAEEASSPTTNCCRWRRRCRCSALRNWRMATCSSPQSAGTYVDRSHTDRQAIFGQQLLAHVPLAAHIRHSLEQEPTGELPEKPFLRLLQESLDAAEAERVLHTAIEWGRHGEVFEYDYHTGMIHLREAERSNEAPKEAP